MPSSARDASVFLPGISARAPAAQARFIPCTQKGPVQRRDGAPIDDDDARLLGLSRDEALFLGTRGDVDYFTAALEGALPEGFVARSLRAIVGFVPDDEVEIVGRAVQIAAWDETHRFCGRCGRPTERSRTERVRKCAACELAVWPRLAPAVIVLVERDDGRALLARAKNFPMPMYSTLAGFVEPGESLEDCVHREIHEEVGVRVADLTYFGSQPWPFPHSLMVGFLARHASGDIAIDEDEILHADWFARDELPMIPPHVSIARRLIDAWLARGA